VATGRSDNREKRVAIIQSNYIPWKGYFDLIAAVDEFVLYDDRQYTRRDWRNRNLIKGTRGLQWLTIPVAVKGRFRQRICETRVERVDWGKQHWEQLRHAYRRAPYFDPYRERLEGIYRSITTPWLSEINRMFLEDVCDILGITTPISWSMDYPSVEGKTANLANLCRALGATHYLSGPSARQYLEPEVFQEAGIVLEYADYGGYRDYPQLSSPFEHGVTILDLIFNTGPAAHDYMKHVKDRP